MTIGERIRKRRLQLGLTVDQVADRLGKNRATVYRYEKDDIKEFSTSILEPLAVVLKTTPLELSGWGTDPEEEAAEKQAESYEQSIIFEVYKSLGYDAARLLSIITILGNANSAGIFEYADFMAEKFSISNEVPTEEVLEDALNESMGIK